jgi:hypothetical protein
MLTRLKHNVGLSLVAFLLGGLILGGSAVAALRIANHSVGWDKLTPGVQARIGSARAPGPQGPAGPTGMAGAIGPQGPSGPENVVGYSSLLAAGDPVETLATIGPLTFTASCAAEGEDTVNAVLTATSAADSVRLNGKMLNQGDSVAVQKLSWSGGGSEENFLPIIRATDATQSFAIEGVPIIIVDVPEGNCRFFGTLVKDG